MGCLAAEQAAKLITKVMKSEPQPITNDLIAQHNLTDDEYQKIVAILRREPNLTELGMFEAG